MSSECVIEFANGMKLAAPSVEINPVGADYLRVTDRRGAKRVFGVGDFIASPQQTMGQLLAALSESGVAIAEGDDAVYPQGEMQLVTMREGLRLCFVAHGDEVDYVRVCRPDGSELVYYDSAEWAEEPLEVLGALVGCLHRGTELL